MSELEEMPLRQREANPLIDPQALNQALCDVMARMLLACASL